MFLNDDPTRNSIPDAESYPCRIEVIVWGHPPGVVAAQQPRAEGSMPFGKVRPANSCFWAARRSATVCVTQGVVE